MTLQNSINKAWSLGRLESRNEKARAVRQKASQELSDPSRAPSSFASAAELAVEAPLSAASVATEGRNILCLDGFHGGEW